MRQLGEPVNAEELRNRLCGHILPHQNNGSLKSRCQELNAKTQAALKLSKAPGIRSAEDKRQIAEAWLNLVADFAKVSVKYEAEELKKWQKQQQTHSDFEMTM